MQLVRVAGDDDATGPTADQRDRCVRDVGSSGRAAELPDRPGLHAVERDERHGLGSQYPDQAYLASRVPPHLRNDGTRDMDLLSQLEQPHDPPIGLLDGDEAAPPSLPPPMHSAGRPRRKMSVGGSTMAG